VPFNDSVPREKIEVMRKMQGTSGAGEGEEESLPSVNKVKRAQGETITTEGPEAEVPGGGEDPSPQIERVGM